MQEIRLSEYDKVIPSNTFITMNGKKRIMMVIDLLNSGGAQRQFVGLAKLLKHKGYEVRVLYYENYTFYKIYLDEDGIENIMLSSSSNKLLHYPSIYRGLKRQICFFRPDVVISYLRFPNIMCCLAHRKNKRFKLIVSERNTTQYLSVLERLKFWSYRWADVIISNSYSQDDFVRSHYPEYGGKSSVITNFVDTDIFVPASHKAESNHPPLILCIGRIMKQKNVIRFLNVVKILKTQGLQFKVCWYGDDSTAYAAECKRHLMDIGIDDCFSFAGRTLSVVQLYQQADIFCLPSEYEGFPNVLCEAMSCGCASVVSDVCDNKAILGGNTDCLFDPFDESDMVHKLSLMIKKSVSERNTIGRILRARAIRLFSAKRFIQDYEAVF